MTPGSAVLGADGAQKNSKHAAPSQAPGLQLLRLATHRVLGHSPAEHVLQLRLRGGDVAQGLHNGSAMQWGVRWMGAVDKCLAGMGSLLGGSRPPAKQPALPGAAAGW